MKTQDLPHQQASARWSNRILILSLLGIAWLTLFPFQLHFPGANPPHRSPLLLGATLKEMRYSDFFLNILLFVPFGFGVCAQARKRGASRWNSLLLALAAGAVVSYLVELLQLYIPDRDSGWVDVVSNSMGSVAGFFLFELCGGAILKVLSECEDVFEAWLSPRRTALLLAAYFAGWFGYSVILQNETRLSNWDPQCTLVAGNDAAGENPWRGQIFLLQIWSRALPEQAIRRISTQESADNAGASLLGSYDFSGSPPYRDQRNLLPALTWKAAQAKLTNAGVPELDGKSWLSADIPVESLTREIKKSNQFTIRIVCAPAEAPGASGRIVSLSQADGTVNLHLRQHGAYLVFYFRNPLTQTGSVQEWPVQDVFDVAGKPRDIVASYDGADAFLYVDGNPVAQSYRLGPGATILHHIYLIRPVDMEGCVIMYLTLVFLPAGVLIGMGAEKWTGLESSTRWLLAFGLVLPAVLLEISLAAISGRRIWAGNIALSLVFGVAGVLLINADRRSENCSRAS
ncbi:MAG TPA: VanZ family protein [Candidatus Acidoferrum sp.]|jgi:VanZ family protein|nr:VanZ family protein [Candidatus Acidoferrum sp.]